MPHGNVARNRPGSSVSVRRCRELRCHGNVKSRKLYPTFNLFWAKHWTLEDFKFELGNDVFVSSESSQIQLAAFTCLECFSDDLDSNDGQEFSCACERSPKLSLNDKWSTHKLTKGDLIGFQGPRFVFHNESYNNSSQLCEVFKRNYFAGILLNNEVSSSQKRLLLVLDVLSHCHRTTTRSFHSKFTLQWHLSILIGFL